MVRPWGLGTGAGVWIGAYTLLQMILIIRNLINAHGVNIRLPASDPAIFRTESAYPNAITADTTRNGPANAPAIDVVPGPIQHLHQTESIQTRFILG